MGATVSKAIFLSWVSTVLLVGLPWLLGTSVSGYSALQLINELGALEQGGRSLATGVFLLTGAFWMGSVEAARKQLEPLRLDAWVRFGAIAFAASLIGRLVFPCDLHCPLDGSVTQVLHNTLVWVLYAGALVAGWRLAIEGGAGRVLKLLLLVCFVLLQLAFWQRSWWPGLWQRGYELSFAGLWLLWLHQITRAPGAEAE